MNDASHFQAGPNPIRFKSQGYWLAGHLFLPDGFDVSKTFPAVVFSGPFYRVDEKMGAVYASFLAGRGYIVLVFDHLGFGDSGGPVRNNEKASWKMEAIRDGVSYLGTLPFVDRRRLFGLGTCASGGYMAIVATTDKRLKAIATVNGMMDNTAIYFGSVLREQIISLLEIANAARQRAYETEHAEEYEAWGKTLEQESLDEEPTPYDWELPSTTTRARRPHFGYTHKAAMDWVEDAPLTSAVALAPYLYTPYLGIYGEKALEGLGALTVTFYNACSEPKELFEVQGASHADLCDVDKYVESIVVRIDDFFRKYSK